MCWSLKRWQTQALRVFVDDERDQYSRESFCLSWSQQRCLQFSSYFFSFVRSFRQKMLLNYLIYHLQSVGWVYCCEGRVYISLSFFNFFIFYALITLNAQDFCRLAFVTSCSAFVSPKGQICSDSSSSRTEIQEKMLQYNLNLFVYSLTKVSLETWLDRKDKFSTARNSEFYTNFLHPTQAPLKYLSCRCHCSGVQRAREKWC